MRIKLILMTGVFLGITTVAHAQGILPPLQTPALSQSTQPVSALLIGQRLPESAVVLDDQAHTRTLLSFKAPLEVLVIYVYSGTCEAEESTLIRYRRLYESFKDWRVAFVELRNGRPAAESPWSFPRVTDPNGRTHRLLGIQGTPMILIIDEGGVLRYRGTLDEGPSHKTSARRALEDVIGHVEPVSDPEPAGQLLCPWP